MFLELRPKQILTQKQVGYDTATAAGDGDKMFRVLGKGEINDTILLWATGETGTWVNMGPK
jgi:hypothetical protein